MGRGSKGKEGRSAQQVRAMVRRYGISRDAGRRECCKRGF